MPNKQKQLTAAIIKAVPEIKGVADCEECYGTGLIEGIDTCPECDGSGTFGTYREPTLADVLFASKMVMSKKNDNSIFTDELENIVKNWDLTKPYSQQPKETINLLHSLLVS